MTNEEKDLLIAYRVDSGELGPDGVAPDGSFVVIVPGSDFNLVGCAGVEAGYGELVRGRVGTPVGLSAVLEVLTIRRPDDAVIGQRLGVLDIGVLGDVQLSDLISCSCRQSGRRQFPVWVVGLCRDSHDRGEGQDGWLNSQHSRIP